MGWEDELQYVRGDLPMMSRIDVWYEPLIACNTLSEREHLPQPISTAKGLQASVYMLPQSSGGTGFCSAANDVHLLLLYHIVCL